MSEPSPIQHSDIIYKLGTLEALVSTGLQNIKEQLNDVKKSVNDNQQETKKELESVKKRLDNIEDWKQAVVERVTVITGAGVIAWTILGDIIKNFISKVFS